MWDRAIVRVCLVGGGRRAHLRKLVHLLHRNFLYSHSTSLTSFWHQMSGITDFSMAFHPRLKYPEHCDEEIPFPPPSSLVWRNDVCLLCYTRTRGSGSGKSDLRRVCGRCSSPMPHPAGLQGLGRLRQRHPSDESAEVEGEGAWPGKDLQWLSHPTLRGRERATLQAPLDFMEVWAGGWTSSIAVF